MEESFFGSAFGILVSVAVGYILFLVLASIFMGICMWHILAKMGQPGWACFIPIYNYYALAAGLYNEGALGLLTLIPGFGALVSLKMIYDMAKCFGKSSAFGVLNIFFSIITYPILAFSGVRYVGPTRITEF